MSIIGVPNLKATGVPADSSRSLRWRDGVIKDIANAGVRFLFDAAFPFSYPGGSPTARPAAAAPANGALVQDVAEIGNGSFVLPGGSVAYANGGFDFTSENGVPAGVSAPASVLADIATPFGGKAQRYLVMAYVKLPTLANWNTAASVLTVIGDRNYAAVPSLIGIHQQTGGILSARRQTAAATAETSNFILTPAAGDYGSVVQLAVWRNDAGQGFRLMSANGKILSTQPVGVDNTQDFSANPFVFGRPDALRGAGTGVLAALSGFKIYRGMVENLARSGRDPVAVLDADYARVIARNAFA